MKIELYINGRVRDVAHLGPDDVDLEDLATTLAKINRFIGRTDHPYSVAQHAVLVSRLCPPDQAYECLHHDDDEAYVGDLASPIKRHAAKGFSALEERIRRRALAPALGLRPVVPKYVHKWDKRARTMEQYHRQRRREGEPYCMHIIDHLACDTVQDVLTWKEARDLYLVRHAELYRAKKIFGKGIK